MHNKKLKMPIMIFLLSLSLSTPIFATNSSNDDVLSNITTKAESIDNMLSDTADNKSKTSNEELFGSAFTMSDNSAVLLEENTLEIDIQSSNYLLERQEDIKDIAINLSNYVILKGTFENPIYVYKTNDVNSDLIGKTTQYSICEVIDNDENWYHVKSNDIEGYVEVNNVTIDNSLYYDFYNQIMSYKTSSAIINDSNAIAISPIDNTVFNFNDIENLEEFSFEVYTQDKNTVTILIDGKQYLLNKDYVTINENEYVILDLFSENEDEIFHDLGYESVDELYQIRSSYVSRKAPLVLTEEEIETLRTDLCDFACQFVGNPYVWGGTNLEKGADCSGFVMKVFQNYDMYLMRVASAQATNGVKIDKDELLPGDLVFYGDGSRVEHVAIYIGDGQIVHAANKKDGIKYSDVDYWRIITCRRIINPVTID